MLLSSLHFLLCFNFLKILCVQTDVSQMFYFVQCMLGISSDANCKQETCFFASTVFFFVIQQVTIWSILINLPVIIGTDGFVCLPGGDVIMMLPVSRFKGQPLGMITSTTPWLPVGSDPIPHWLWLASWSAATYQAMPPMVFYHPPVWIPEYTHLIKVTHTWYKDLTLKVYFETEPSVPV